MRALNWMVATTVAAGMSLAAHADPAKMHGISRYGDGVTPSYSDYTSKYSPEALAPKRTVGSVGAMGGYSMSVPIETPPALVPAAVALAYDSSAARSPSWVAPGWSLAGPPMLAQVSPAERRAEWGGDEHVYRVGGTTLIEDPTLSSIPIGGPYIGPGATYFRATSVSAGETVAAYDDLGEVWWVFDGTTLSKFEPELDAATDVTRWRCAWQRDTSMNIAAYEYDVEGRLTWAYAGANQPLSNAEPLEPYPHLIEIEIRYEPRPTDGSEVIRESVVDGVLRTYDQRVEEVIVRARKNVTEAFQDFRRYFPRYGSGPLSSWGEMPTTPGPYLLAIDAEGSAATDGSGPITRRLHQLEYEEFARPSKPLVEQPYTYQVLIDEGSPAAGDETYYSRQGTLWTSDDDIPFDAPLGASTTMSRTWSLRRHWEDYTTCSETGCSSSDFTEGDTEAAKIGAKSWAYATTHQLTVAADFNRDGLTDIRFASPDNVTGLPNGGTTPHLVEGGERKSRLPVDGDPSGIGTLDLTIPEFQGAVPTPHNQFDVASLGITSSIPFGDGSFQVERRALIDVNGDGAPDLIDSTNDIVLENPYGADWTSWPSEVGTTVFDVFDSTPGVSVDPTWIVHFARSDGSFAPGVPLEAPTWFPGLRYVRDHCTEMFADIRARGVPDGSEPPGWTPPHPMDPDEWYSEAEGAEVQLLDINGDALVDVVEIGDTETTVRYGLAVLASEASASSAASGPSGVATAWGPPVVIAAIGDDSEELQDVLAGSWERHLVSPASGTWSIYRWYRQMYDDSDLYDDYIGTPRTWLPEYWSPSCAIGEVQSRVDWIDFNADGYLDLVSAELGTVAESRSFAPDQPTAWTVFLGTGLTGEQAFLAPIDIDAPTDRGVRVTQEGAHLVGSFGNAGYGGVGIDPLPAFRLETSGITFPAGTIATPSGGSSGGGGSGGGITISEPEWGGFNQSHLGSPETALYDAMAFAATTVTEEMMNPTGGGPVDPGPSCLPDPPYYLMLGDEGVTPPETRPVYSWTTRELSGGYGGIISQADKSDWDVMRSAMRADRVNSTSKVIARLMDIDQDGLPDFVFSGSKRWYELMDPEGSVAYWKNLGLVDGFSLNQCGAEHTDRYDFVESCEDLEWLGHGLSGSMTMAALGASCTGSSSSSVTDYDDGACRTDSRTERRDLRQVGDFNGDGIIDVLDFEDGVYRPGTPQGRGILLRSESHGGWEESVDYRPAPWGFPAGHEDAWAPIADPDDGRWSRAGWVAQTVRHGDQVTGAFGYDLYSFEQGDCAGGRCRGFATRVHSVCAPELQLDAAQEGMISVTPQESHSPFEGLQGCVHDFNMRAGRNASLDPAEWHGPFHADIQYAAPLRREVTTSRLERVGALVESTEVWADDRVAHTSTYDLPGTVGTDHLAFESSMTWGEPDGSPCEDDSNRCRPLTQFIKQYALDAPGPGGGPLPEELSLTFLYESLLGLPTQIDETSTDGLNRIRSIDWTINADATWAVPSGEQLAGDDPSLGWAVHEGVVWEYDDLPPGSTQLTRGLMTAQEVCATTRPDVVGSAAGFTCAGETIRWDFGRYTRGPVQSIQGPRGSSSLTEVFRYGGTSPGKVVNALGHTSFTAIDDFGRTWKERDPNDIVVESVYDGWGRASRSYLTGKGGTVPFERTTSAYRDWPTFGGGGGGELYRMVLESTHDVDDFGASIGTVRAASVLDGAGNTRQEWRQAPPDENGWIVVNHWYDIFGQELFTSEPTFVPHASRAGPSPRRRPSPRDPLRKSP